MHKAKKLIKRTFGSYFVTTFSKVDKKLIKRTFGSTFSKVDKKLKSFYTIINVNNIKCK